MHQQERFGIIGTGRVGTAMARILDEAGRSVTRVFDLSHLAVERASRLCGAEPADDPAGVVRDSDVILITTPDDCIESTCNAIAESGLELDGKVFIHMSGALPVSALGALGRLGADTLCIHPLQTFPDIEGAVDSLPGSTFGVTCSRDSEAWARELVTNLGGGVLLIEDDDKVLYHAAAVTACNLFAMLEHGAMEIYKGLGFQAEEAVAAIMPLVRATVDNIEELGPAGALTGPLARGDIGTVEAHLGALDEFDEDLASLYRVVSLWGLRIVEERGEVDRSIIDTLRRVLTGDRGHQG